MELKQGSSESDLISYYYRIKYILLWASISIVMWFKDFWNSTHYVINKYSLVFLGMFFLYIIIRKEIKTVRILGTLLYLFTFFYLESNEILSFSTPFYSTFFFIVTAMMVYMDCQKGVNERINEEKHYVVLFKKVTLVILVTFLIWGLKIYLIHLNRGNTVCAVVCVAFAIWSFDFIEFIRWGFSFVSEWFSKITVKAKKKDKVSKWKIFIGCFLIIFISELIVSAFFYPGILSPDNFSAYYAALHLDDPDSRTDIHSFAFTLLFKLILSVSQNYYCITLLFVLSFSVIWAYWMVFLFERGASPIVVFGISVIWILMPTNQYILVTSWKDTPFTQCMMLLTLMLAKIVTGDDYSAKDHIFLILSMIGTALFRSNGQVVALVCIAVIIAYSIKKYINRKLIKSVIIAAVLILLIKIPIYKALHVTGAPSGFAGLPFLDAVWFNIHSGNKLEKDALEFAESFMPISEWENGYTDGQLSTGALHMTDWDDINFENAAKAYLWCLNHYPVTTIWSRFNRTYNLWGVIPDIQIPVSQNLVLENYGSEEYSFDFLERFSHQRELLIAGHLDNYLWGAFFQVMNRSGTWLMLWLILFWITGFGYKIVLVALPAFANTFALMIGCCYQDYRYSYPAVICSVLGMLFMLTEGIGTKKSHQIEGDRR